LTVSTLIILSVVVGFLGLDATGALQVMVSRPLVVGAVTGWVLGDTAMGLASGSLVEMVWMGGVPVGALVPPDGTTAAAVAAAVAVVLGHTGHPAGSNAAGALGVLAAVPAGMFGARIEVLQRRLVNRLSRRAESALASGRLNSVGCILVGALALAWLRGALVCGLCLALGIPALGWILAHLPYDGMRALGWCFWLFWLLGLAEAANHFWERRGLKYAAVMALAMALVGNAPGAGQIHMLVLAVAGALAAGLWRYRGARRGEMA
jgi:mannose/fructose/N-acetylgalactosamine-specific phosphotransferase system component IIC